MLLYIDILDKLYDKLEIKVQIPPLNQRLEQKQYLRRFLIVMIIDGTTRGSNINN